MAIEDSSGWTFLTQCQIPKDIHTVLATGERPICAFKTVRDAAVFTNKRLIIRDAPTVVGKKVEMYSLPFRSFEMWATENAGHLDFSAELEIWTKFGTFKISLGRGINVRALDRLIAECVLAS